MPPSDRDPQRKRNLRRVRGGVLAEFAILSLVVWMMLAGILELGRALTVQQLLQTNARTLARELARLPLDANLSFADALASPDFSARVLDTRFLVIDSALLARCGLPDFGQAGHEAGLDALFADRPFGNRALRPLMIADRRGDLQMIRYPGTLLERTASAPAACEDGSNFAVRIPQLDPASGSYQWVDVVSSTDPSSAADRFPLSAGGWAGLRLNYPFQSVGMLAGRGTGEINPATGREFVTLVEDVGAAPAPPSSFSISVSERDAGAYAGSAGLGRFYSIPGAGGAPRAVRPFRRVLSASAGFRREIFVSAGGA
ncbi:MAG: TadE/TadG family type IV pilus assembly protein [Myxococcota bacterium]